MADETAGGPQAGLAATLTVPAHPAFLETCRSLIAALAAQTDMGVDVIEDLRIAVDEAAGQLLSHGGGSDLSLDVSMLDGMVTLRLSLTSPPSGTVISKDGGYAWIVLDAVADEVQVGADDCSITVTRSWRTLAGAE